MTFRAIDPETGEVHDAGWFHERRIRKGYCEVCRELIELRAEQSIDTSVHFWHGKGAICPTIKANRKKYEDLPASATDVEAGKRLREEIKENLFLIYGCCGAIVDGLKYAEFKELISKATNKGIWNYHGLKLNYIPYLLVTFHDMFYAKGSKLRDERYYVILEPGLQYLDDLWNSPKDCKQKIWKVSPNRGVIEELDIQPHLDPEPSWFKSAKQYLNV